MLRQYISITVYRVTVCMYVGVMRISSHGYALFFINFPSLIDSFNNWDHSAAANS